jgi:hypothetical protein
MLTCLFRTPNRKPPNMCCHSTCCRIRHKSACNFRHCPDSSALLFSSWCSSSATQVEASFFEVSPLSTQMATQTTGQCVVQQSTKHIHYGDKPLAALKLATTIRYTSILFHEKKQGQSSFGSMQIHSFIRVKVNCRQPSFAVRNVNAWNSLPQTLIDADSVFFCFKALLTKIKLSEFLTFK